jgi:hypothetical protein
VLEANEIAAQRHFGNRVPSQRVGDRSEAPSHNRVRGTDDLHRRSPQRGSADAVEDRSSNCRTCSAASGRLSGCRNHTDRDRNEVDTRRLHCASPSRTCYRHRDRVLFTGPTPHAAADCRTLRMAARANHGNTAPASPRSRLAHRYSEHCSPITLTVSPPFLRAACCR